MGEFSFHPELFEERARAQEGLAEAGYVWFSDYASISPEHETYGLEVAGIRDLDCALEIAEVLLRTFPEWRQGRMQEKEWWSREPGWVVVIEKSGPTVPSADAPS